MMQAQWWCSAQGIPWSWEWRAYPGVWAAVMVVLVVLTARLARANRLPWQRAGVAWAYVGVALFWIALDWPIGALGAGYLASVHGVKFLLLAFVIPPLLWLPFRDATGPVSKPSMAAPLYSAAFFTLALIVSHAPVVVNSLAESQLGSFSIDALWFGAGMLFWRPVVVAGRLPHPLLKMGYVFFGTLGHNFLGMYLLLSKLPLYAVFELAPRVHDLDARTDQGVAGALMLLAVTPLIFSVEIILFVQWIRNSKTHKAPLR